ncbi:hypothetical protein [Haloarcula onubensis]|nr:hypothetical protein [Halomicroarcula sp. S3CR25-11]
MPSPPFVDRGTGELDRDQLLAEAIPLGKLVGLFAALAVVPFALAFLLGGSNGVLGALFVVVGQFVLAVGTGIVLIYVVARGIQLAEA